MRVYVYVNIDDTWEGTRDANGVLQPNEKFPDMKALAVMFIRRVMKIGIYSSPGAEDLCRFLRGVLAMKSWTPGWAGWA